jgi:hypothetical protein
MRKAVLIFCLLQYTHDLTAQQKQFTVSEIASSNSFSVFTAFICFFICIDNNDAKVVSIAADAFAKDAELISGKQMQVSNSIQPGTVSIIAGTIGKSKFIDELIKQKQVDVSLLKTNGNPLS